MAKNDEVLTKKEQEQFKKEALKVLNDEIKGELVSSVVSDVKKEIDNVMKDVEYKINHEYKEELKDKISNEIAEDIKTKIRKEEKKLSRRKSWKIFRMSIYILVLLAFSGFLIYKLYNAGELEYVDKYIDKVISTTSKTSKETTTTTMTTTKSLEELTEIYGTLVDDLKITNVDLVKKDTLVSEISNADKVKMAYLSLKEEDILKEGVIYQITNETMEVAYKGLFGETESYEPVGFTANGLSYAYSDNTKMYIALCNNGETEEGSVRNHIYEIVESDSQVTINAYVSYVKNNRVYNVNNTNRYLGTQDRLNIDQIKNKLTKVSYVFNLENGSYYLYSINLVN